MGNRLGGGVSCALALYYLALISGALLSLSLIIGFDGAMDFLTHIYIYLLFFFVLPALTAPGASTIIIS